MRPDKTGRPPPAIQGPALLSRLPRKLRKLLYRNYRQRSRYRLYDRLGLRLWLNYANYVDRQLIIREPYEMEQLDHLMDLAAGQAFDLFLDVGANFGLYAMLMARTGRFADIVAFEPDPRNYRQLVTNIAINGLASEIRLFACGLSDRDARANFLQAHERSTGMSRVGATAAAGTRRVRYTDIRVPVIRFDGHFTCNGRRVMIKIDVEGHELQVIDGMQRLLEGNDCLIQVEVFDAGIGQVDARLAGLGYRNYASFGHDRLYRRGIK